MTGNINNNRNTFTGIPVINAAGVEKYFDFEVGEEGNMEHARITMDGYQLMLDQQFNYMQGDLPEEWRELAINKLVELIEVERKREDNMF